VADPDATLRPVAFIDDDEKKMRARRERNTDHRWSLQMMERRFALGVRAVIVASDGLPELRLAELGQLCDRSGVALLKLRISLTRSCRRRRPSSAARDGHWSSREAEQSIRACRRSLA